MPAPMNVRTVTLRSAVQSLRDRLAPHFAEDTAIPGSFDPGRPSSGHCAAASFLCVLYWREQPPLPGARVGFVSSRAPGVSHWFVRLETDTAAYDIDITGDQFDGRPAVQIAPAGTLYEDTGERAMEEVNEETRRRAWLLADRSGLASDLTPDVAA